MRIGNLDGRLTLITDDGGLDIATASDGLFGPDPQDAFADWDALRAWAADASLDGLAPVAVESLGPPVPRPAQVFAVALNYVEHAGEAGATVPDVPLVFTKFPTCLVGPVAEVQVATPKVDWEVELVVVIGARADAVAEADAWEHVAGLMVGQDLSARDVQRLGPSPQFSLAKSFAGFGPTGPALVTPDEVDLDALELTCELNGEVVQQALASEMVFDVAALIAYISRICPLLPGDLVFTGTPSGVGVRRDPPRFLTDGDVLTSAITGLGELTQTFVAPSAARTTDARQAPAARQPERTLR